MKTRQQQEAIDCVDDLIAENERLTVERDYLDKRLAEFENMARDFVEFKAPDHICRMHFEFMLIKCDGRHGE